MALLGTIELPHTREFVPRVLLVWLLYLVPHMVMALMENNL